MSDFSGVFWAEGDFRVTDCVGPRQMRIRRGSRTLPKASRGFPHGT